MMMAIDVKNHCKSFDEFYAPFLLDYEDDGE